MTPVLRNRLWLAATLSLTVAKLWLSRGQGVYAIGGAGHDDRLFIELAQHLVRGEWLGSYNELTLAKGPFYPLFIAAAFLIGLPLFLAQHIFYAAACGAFVRALRPAITSAGVRFGIFALLLWNPMTYDGPSMGRVLRQHVYGPLGLMILAGLVALYLRRSESVRRQWPWAVLAGAAAGCFYLTREESLWIIPSVALLGGACLFGAWRLSRATVIRSGALLALGAMVASVPVVTVCALNKKYYDWFGTCEFHAKEFRDAYGAMLRVRVGPELPLVPVTREAREAMAQVSPQFALLQQQFEAGGLAQGWAGASEFFTKLPPEQGQIGGGWFMWALREAVTKAGHGGDANQAMIFYRQMADEINRACDEGRLPAGPRRSGFMPRWHDSQTPVFARATREFTDFVIRFSRFGGKPPPSTGSGEELQLFRDITRERLSPPDGELDVVGAARYLLNVWKAEILHRIGKALRPVLMVLFWLATIVGLARTGWLLWHRRWTYPLTVAAAAGGACAASILMHAMIEASSFPVHAIGSFAPIYPLLLVFITTVIWDAIAAWQQRKSDPLETPAQSATAQAATTVSQRGWLTWLAGALALLPFVIWQAEFKKLIWFADDIYLVDQMTVMTPTEWCLRVFAESFQPLFKMAWSTVVLLGGGSYQVMLWCMWLTHAFNTVLLGRLLLRAGFPWMAALTASLLFGLTAANIESLGWAVVWSGLLSAGFLLLGLNWIETRSDTVSAKPWRFALPLALLAAASACSFARGVASGAVLAFAVLVPAVLGRQWRALPARLPAAGLCLLASLAVAVVIKSNSTGNHQHLAGAWGDAFEFGLIYFLLNPTHGLLGSLSFHPIVLLALAGAKLGLLALALGLAHDRTRQLLLVLLAADVACAVLLGIGRYHTGFLAALSSRYQYLALITTLPAMAFVLTNLIDRVLPSGRWQTGLRAALLLLIAVFCLQQWPKALNDFTGWRGTEMRQLLAAPPTSDPSVRVPALEFMHIERAKALQRTYNLH